MSVQRDQVDAQKYVHRRVVNALLTSDADTQQTPLRSVARATVVSMILGALIVGGFLAYGFISKGGNTGWQEEGSVVIAEETGTRYVYLDGLLHPVANLTSARLISGSGATDPVYVSANSIATAPRGAPLGILGAPDAMPAPEDLVHEPWSACSALTATSSGELAPVVQVGPGTPGGAQALLPDEAVLVGVEGSEQLVWAGARWRLGDSEMVLTAFNEPAATPVDVGTAWVNAVPAAGTRLEAPDIPGHGEPGAMVAGVPTLVGQVFVTELADGEQYYLAVADGLLPVPSPLAALILADPRNTALYADGRVEAIATDAAAVTAVGLSQASPPAEGLPEELPVILNADLSEHAGLCVTYAGSEEAADLVVSVVDPLELVSTAGAGSEPPTGAAVDYALSDRVGMTPGTGALVRAQTPDGGGTGTVYVVTDQGVKYPVAGAEALDALGYDGVTPDPLPRELLDVIPTGPSLDPLAARTVVDPSTAS